MTTARQGSPPEGTDSSQPKAASADLPLTADHQMALARPWDYAEEGSIWEISGLRTSGTQFDRCLAMVVPAYITGVESPPTFLFIHPGLTLANLYIHDQVITSGEITAARPLLLVHRDEPTKAYQAHDQDWLDQWNEPPR